MGLPEAPLPQPFCQRHRHISLTNHPQNGARDKGSAGDDSKTPQPRHPLPCTHLSECSTRTIEGNVCDEELERTLRPLCGSLATQTRPTPAHWVNIGPPMEMHTIASIANDAEPLHCSKMHL